MVRIAGPMILGCLLAALVAGPTLADDGSTVAVPSLDRPAGPARSVQVVRPGDCLWTIARSQLAERHRRHRPADVAAQWPRWYAANRAVVGADPDLIHPGQRLRTPRPARSGSSS